MKQVTVRFGDMAFESLEEIKRIYGERSYQNAILRAVILFDHDQKEISLKQKKITELEAVVQYLEAQLKARG